MTPNQQCDRKYHTSSTTSKAEAPSALPEAAAMTQELTDIRYTRLRSTTAASVSRVKAPSLFQPKDRESPYATANTAMWQRTNNSTGNATTASKPLQ